MVLPDSQVSGNWSERHDRTSGFAHAFGQAADDRRRRMAGSLDYNRTTVSEQLRGQLSLKGDFFALRLVIGIYHRRGAECRPDADRRTSRPRCRREAWQDIEIGVLGSRTCQ